jgi:hypothetical protein
VPRKPSGQSGFFTLGTLIAIVVVGVIVSLEPLTGRLELSPKQAYTLNVCRICVVDPPISEKNNLPSGDFLRGFVRHIRYVKELRLSLEGRVLSFRQNVRHRIVVRERSLFQHLHNWSAVTGNRDAVFADFGASQTFVNYHELNAPLICAQSSELETPSYKTWRVRSGEFIASKFYLLADESGLPPGNYDERYCEDGHDSSGNSRHCGIMRANPSKPALNHGPTRGEYVLFWLFVLTPIWAGVPSALMCYDVYRITKNIDKP